MLAVSSTFAQDPPSELFNSWYYIGWEGDLGYYAPLNVSPPVNPTLVIETDLSFNGTGACNTFSGTFIFDPVFHTLEVDAFQRTSNQCQYQSHTDLDNDYFSWFEFHVFQPYGIEVLTSNYFAIVSFTGFGPHFSTTPFLGSYDNITPSISVYPNPSIDFVYLDHAQVPINFEIVDLNGRIIKTGSYTNKGIHVENLSKGLYFLLLNAENSVQSLKFIKQ